MRKEPFTIDDYVHVYNRGNRKMDIVYNESDKWRFLKILRYFNDEYSPDNIFRELYFMREAGFYRSFMWPQKWPLHRPLVKIISFCLIPNHFHLLLREIKKGGITKFMSKLGTGFTNYINIKYKETGRLFQGPYKAKTVDKMEYLQYLNVYIQVLNIFEIYPGGLTKAVEEFDKAFEFAVNYHFGSLSDFLKKRNLEIIEMDIFEEMFPNVESYKDFVYDCLIKRNLREVLGKLVID